MLKKELIRSFLSKFKKHLIIISLSSGLLVFFLTVMFPAMDPGSTDAVSSNWPRLMKDVFGDPLTGFSDIYGWFQLELFHITFWVIFGIFSSFLASHIIAKEYENRTIDLIFSLPIKRTTLIINRLISLLLLLFLAVLPTLLGCILGIASLKLNLNPLPLLAAILNGFLLCLLYAAISLFISLFTRSQTASILISLAVFGFFFLLSHMIIPIIPALKSFDVISPFHYYDTASILIRHSYSLLNPVILFLGFVVFSSLSCLLLEKKDIIC